MYDDVSEEDYGTYYGTGMGLALPAVGGAISAIGGLFSRNKDSGRLASNAEAYNLAINGNPPYKDQPSALDFLRVMSTSWATTVAKNDARTKYNAAQAIIAKQGTPRSTTYGGTTAVPSSPLGGPVVAGLSTGPLLIAGAAAVALFALTRGRRR